MDAEEWANLEELIFEITAENVEEKATEISGSKFVCTENDTKHLLKFLHRICSSNSSMIPQIAELIHYLNEKIPENIKFFDIVQSQFSECDISTFSFYRLLFLYNSFPIENIVEVFHANQYESFTRKSLLITFLPELYHFDQETVTMAAKQLASSDDIYHSNLTNENLQEMLPDLTQLLSEGAKRGTVEWAIKHDQPNLLKALSESSSLEPTQNWISSNFDIFKVEGPILQAAAYYGAVGCFKYLFLSGGRDEENDGQLIKAAVIGGSDEILHILQQSSHAFDGTLSTASNSFNPRVFKWLLSSFPAALLIKPLTANAILSNLVKIGDYASILAMVKSDLRNMLKDVTNVVFAAAKEGDAPIFAFLFDAFKFNVNETNSSGSGLLHMVGSPSVAAFVFAQPSLDVSIKNRDGFTPLHEYASRNRVSVARKFLDRCPNSLNSTSVNGMTPLHCAAAHGCDRFVRFLINRGANVNAKDRDKNTPLHYAARASSAATIEALLESKDIDITLENAFGDTPFFLAAKDGSASVFSTLTLLTNADINAADADGMTALTIAIDRLSMSLFSFLLSQDSINVNRRDTISGRTPLMHAIAAEGEESKEMFDLLMIVHGIDINAQDKEWNTAAHIAIECDKEYMLRNLLEKKGIDLNISNGKKTVQQAVLHYGKSKDIDFTELLEKAALSPKPKTKISVPPLDESPGEPLPRLVAGEPKKSSKRKSQPALPYDQSEIEESNGQGGCCQIV